MDTLTRRLATALLAALWLLAVFSIVFPEGAAAVAPVMAGLLAAFVLVALPRTTWHTRVLCGVLGAATALLGAVYGHWEAVPEGLARATIFAPFLSTIVLLRATAEQRPEITAARRMFGALDPERRDSAVVLGTHLLGSVLQVGVFAILAPILGRDASDEQRREVFVVATRGMSLVPLWSPFVVGMAVATQYLPAVPLWEIMALGITMTVVAILISFFAFDRRSGFRSFVAALRSLAPVAPPIAVAAMIVIAATAAGGLSTLQALIIGLPAPCLLVLLAQRGASPVEAVRQTARGLHRIGPEVSILTFATTLGLVFEASLPGTGLLDWLTRQAPPPWVIIFVVVMAMNVTGLLGVHAIVSGTVLLVVFTSIPTQLSDLALMQALLTGWGLSTAISVGSLSIATGAAMFGVPPTRLITARNIAFVFSASAVIATLLSLLDGFFAG